MEIKFKIDKENKTIMFYFSEADMTKIAKTCYEENISPTKASDNITIYLYNLMVKVSKIIGINLHEYTPNMTLLTEKDFEAVKPEEDMDILIIKGGIKHEE